MFAAVFIPDLSLQAVLRAGPELRAHPVALIDPELGTEIIQLTSSAENFGVAKGLTPAQAMARCAELKIKVRSQPQEASATEILLQTAYAFSPNIESTALGVCTLALNGLGLNDQSALKRWAEKLLRALELFDLQGKIGIAPTPELALLAAQFTEPQNCAADCEAARQRESDLRSIRASQSVPGKDGVFIVGAPDDFIGRLPLAALRPSPEIAAILSRWGIQNAGQFLALGRNEVSERLGAGALELFGRIAPQAVRPLKLISPPEHFSEQIEFENGVETVAPLIFVLRRFVEQLSWRLQAIYLVIGEFYLRLDLSSGGTYEHTFKIPSATGNIETLFRMLQTHLETVRTDSPIVSLRLGARPARPEMHQFGLFENTLRNPNQFAETLARLAALVGPEKAGTPALEATHRPDSFRMRRPDFDFVSAQNSKLKPQSGPQLRRFRPPLPAEFKFRGTHPTLIRSGTLNGTVTDSRGPFLSSGNWWDDSRWAREEWDVEMAEGALLRIFRSNGCCYIEGVYD